MLVSEAVEELAGKLSAAIATEKKEIADQKTALEEERAALAAEKAAMSVVIAKDEDIIELNVGGRLLSTTRGVLTQEEGLLAGMFSGRWDKSFAMDKDGRPFFDFDPDCFEVVLRELRLRQLTGKPTKWHLVKAPLGADAYFKAFKEFLSLGLAGGMPVYRFGMTNSNVSGGGETMVARQGGSSGHTWAIGDTVMESGVFTWGFQVHTMAENNWMYLGVIGMERPQSAESFSNPTSNGWAGMGQVYMKGVCRPSGGWTSFQAADKVKMQLNADEGVLRMKVERLGDTVYEILGLGRHSWRVHVNLHGACDSVELLASEF